MDINKTGFNGLVIIEPKVFSDDRGYFYEAWNRDAFVKAGIPADYAQDNQSGSVRNVIRGLHLQLPPHAQGKLVRVVKGAVLDVAVDLRRDEPTFGQHFKIKLHAGDHQMVYIPQGFAHGFRTLEDDTIFLYKCTHAYHKDSEYTIRWDDPDLGIDWETSEPVLSEKDRQAPPFSEFNSPF